MSIWCLRNSCLLVPESELGFPMWNQELPQAVEKTASSRITAEGPTTCSEMVMWTQEASKIATAGERTSSSEGLWGVSWVDLDRDGREALPEQWRSKVAKEMPRWIVSFEPWLFWKWKTMEDDSLFITLDNRTCRSQ